MRFVGLVLALAIMSSCGSSSDPGASVEEATTATSSPTTDPGPTATSAPVARDSPTVLARPSVQASYVISDFDDPELLPLGETVFVAQCAGCHGSTGGGTERAPSLVGIADKQPDRLVHIDTVTYGTGEMRPRPGWLTPEEVDAVVSYLRLTFIAEPVAGDD